MPTGQCLCGAIRFDIRGELAPVQVCHCVDCRRAQGTPFATNVPVALQQLTFTSDTGTLSSFESSPGKRRWFCARCGSPLYSERSSLPGVVRLRAGLLDEPVDLTVEGHGFWSSRCRWWQDTDALPRHDGVIPARDGP
jgi:hypothetical protein